MKISFDAARSLDRYLRVRARHPQAYSPQLWLGAGNRGPMSASGIYQAIVRRGRQCGIDVYPHRFRHHFSHTWLDRGGAEGDLMELNGWTSPQMLRRYGASARSARASPADYAWPGERAEVIALCVAYQGGLPGLVGRRSRAPPRSS